MHHTLYDKVWRDHVVDEAPDGTCLLYIDRHLVHEVDSPQVFATQTLIQRKSNNMRVVVDGMLPSGVSAKDIILSIIGEIGAAGGIGYAMELSGEAIRALSMEGRMTVCNMSVEAGARTGIM